VIPYYLDLENEVHQIIYDGNLPYEPCTLYTQLPIVLLKPSLHKTIPPNIRLHTRKCDRQLLLVHTVHFSTMQWGMNETVLTLREKAVKHLKSSILNSQLKDLSLI